MKKDHLAESTIKVTDRRLRLMAKNVSLDNSLGTAPHSLANPKQRGKATRRLAIEESVDQLLLLEERYYLLS